MKAFPVPYEEMDTVDSFIRMEQKSASKETGNEHLVPRHSRILAHQVAPIEENVYS